MIVLFPMLTSKSISPNVIPGLCKTLEKFVLVYKMDDVMKAAGLIGAYIGASKIAASSLLKSEAEYLSYEKGKGYKKEDGGSHQPSDYQKEKDKADFVLRARKDQRDEDKSTFEIEREKRKEKVNDLTDLQQNFKLDIEMAQTNNISIEPTWVTVSSKYGSQILGVKVVPFYIDTDVDVLAAMLHDQSLRKLDKKIHAAVRKIVRIVYAGLRKLPWPLKVSNIISDDVDESILFAKTEHGKNVFLCLNYSDINNSNLILNAKTVSSLFGTGWNSFIAADDINKRAIFCMKEFKGMCSTIPYSYLYANVSKEASRIYQSLEDIKKSASPFFKLTSSTKKIFGESLAYAKLNKYLKLLY